MTQIIPRTSSFESRFNARMKFLFGSDVHIGDVFTGWETIDGDRNNTVCIAIHYDGKTLYVLHDSNVTLFNGDMANYHGTLMADQKWNTYNIPSLRQRLDKYMTKKGLTAKNPGVIRGAMWQAKWPECLINERVRVYELTKDMSLPV